MRRISVKSRFLFLQGGHSWACLRLGLRRTGDEVLGEQRAPSHPGPRCVSPRGPRAPWERLRVPWCGRQADPEAAGLRRPQASKSESDDLSGCLHGLLECL